MLRPRRHGGTDPLPHFEIVGRQRDFAYDDTQCLVGAAPLAPRATEDGLAPSAEDVEEVPRLNWPKLDRGSSGEQHALRAARHLVQEYEQVVGIRLLCVAPLTKVLA